MLNFTAISERYIKHAKGTDYSLVLDIILFPATLILGLVTALSDFLHSHGFLKVQEPPLPLISVGNLTYGGTNKTPFVIMLAEYAKSKGIKTGIVLRGYRGKAQDPTIVLAGKGERDITGDEAVMISRKLPDVPVAVALKRIDGVLALREIGVELVIADDAFQHRAMSRDCDIVLIDALCPDGNGRLSPSGIMREKFTALKRSDIVVITKASMADSLSLKKIYDTVRKFVESKNIFLSDLIADGWLFADEEPANVFAFSATGSPESFVRWLEQRGCNVAGSTAFTDHHKYTHEDVKRLNAMAASAKADYIVCTEKDLANMTDLSRDEFSLPVAVPKVKVSLREPERFFARLAEIMRPQIVIASNGYGEDAIASVLAKKMRKAYPLSEVYAFPLVGRGEAFRKAGIDVISAKSVTPSAGVFKYSKRELWADIKAGLLRQVREQLRDWCRISRKILTPVCVGDVYLLLNTLWGCGKRPLFVATAKTVYISGHWRTERALIRNFTLKTWTRDQPTASQLGGNSKYSGSPIMDLLGDAKVKKGNVILLLPGSRKSANNDVKTLLAAVEIMFQHGHDKFRMVLAPTLDFQAFFESCESEGWTRDSQSLNKNEIKISLTTDEIAKSCSDACVLLGMGGTANQLCAGLGVPVIAPDNKGKRVQKKLLGDAEILTSSSPQALAECALAVLSDSGLYDFMSRTGRSRMGMPGACDDVIKTTSGEMGWKLREIVYSKLL